MTTTCPVVHPDRPSVTCAAGGRHEWHLGTDPHTGELVEWSTPVPAMVAPSEVTGIIQQTRSNARRLSLSTAPSAEPPAEPWRELAYRAAMSVARQMDTFTVDDVWLALPPDAVCNEDPRVMNLVMTRLAENGIAERTNMAQRSRRRKGDCRVWRSLVRV